MNVDELPLLIADPATKALNNLPDWWNYSQEIITRSYYDNFPR